MTQADWEFVTNAFNQALDLPPEDRASLLDRECAGRDPVLRRELEAMLTAETASRGFLEHTPVTGGPPQQQQLPGGWQIQDKLGEGGMGAVYRVRRQVDGAEQIAAAKFLPALRTPIPEFARRLRAERRILASLEHPNITRILDGGAIDDAPYFIMELVDGAPLLDYVASLPVSTRDRLLLFQKICAAIGYAHQRLVVHRDIKPSNILITRDGEPKILDFGIAKALEPDTDSTTTGNTDDTATIYRVASVPYASPEHLRGEPASTSSDIYSLGVLLFEMLTGVRRQAPAQGKPEPLPKASLVKAGLSQDLDAILEKATRLEPEARYPSVEQLSRDIGRYLAGRPVEAREGAWRYVAMKFLLRNKLAAGAAIVLTLLAGAYVVQSRRAERQLRETSEMAGLLAVQMPGRLQNGAESLRFRRKVAAYGLDYLNERRRRGDWDPAQLALGYFNLANTFGSPEQISLGEFPKAAECYRHVIDLLWDRRPQATAAHRNALSLSMLRLPRVYLRMRKPERAGTLAQECIDKASTLQPSNGVRRLLANCRFTLSIARSDQGRPEPELAAASAVEILQTLHVNEDPEVATELLSAAANRASAVSLRLAKHDDVIRYAMLSIEAAGREGAGPESLLMQGVAYRNAANGRVGLRQAAEAKAAFNESIRILRELSRQEPDDIQSRAFLSQALIEQSALLPEPQAKMANLREAVTTLRAIVDGSRYPIARSLLARAFDEQAGILEAANPESACELRAAAAGELDNMAAEGVLLPSESEYRAQIRTKSCR